MFYGSLGGDSLNVMVNIFIYSKYLLKKFLIKYSSVAKNQKPSQTKD